MLPGSVRQNPLPLSASVWICLILYPSLTFAVPQALPSILENRDSNPLNIDWGPAPSPQDGPPISAGALRNTAFLPAQIGGIVGAYAVSLVLVAITLLALSKKRRQHLNAGSDEVDYKDQGDFAFPVLQSAVFSVEDVSQVAVPNFSYPSPTGTDFGFGYPPPVVHHSPSSSVSGPGIDLFVDQRIVTADRIMAQQQLEDIYRHVMEHEEAKLRGVTLETPAPPRAISERQPSISERSTRTTLSKKERAKPASLNLSIANDDKPQSRTSSILSALRSPKKKSFKGANISSPIMTPQSATFPRQQEYQEMNSMPPRHYGPVPPPPVPTGLMPPPLSTTNKNHGAPLTPDISPESVQSIDERLGLQMTQSNIHARTWSQAPTEVDPESATTEHSQVPLMGPPTTTRQAAARLPSLPASPKPGATFQRTNAPSAIRTGGSLPLRAYEPAMTSPSAVTHTTKQTVFERKGPLSPTSGRTPGTAGAVPYSPYQPFTPCMPVTPGLVTKDDRKRMRRVMPKSPTMEMVQSSDDVW